MSKLKLGALPDEKPVKVTVEMTGAAHRELILYAEVFAAETGQAPPPPEKLLVPMAMRLMATDRVFLKARKAILARQPPSDRKA